MSAHVSRAVAALGTVVSLVLASPTAAQSTTNPNYYLLDPNVYAWVEHNYAGCDGRGTCQTVSFFQYEYIPAPFDNRFRIGITGSATLGRAAVARVADFGRFVYPGPTTGAPPDFLHYRFMTDLGCTNLPTGTSGTCSFGFEPWVEADSAFVPPPVIRGLVAYISPTAWQAKTPFEQANFVAWPNDEREFVTFDMPLVSTRGPGYFNVVPEPATAVLTCAGLIGILCAAARRRHT